MISARSSINIQMREKIENTDPTQVINDAQLRIRAIAALKQELGMANMLRFLALIHQSPTDYVDISKQLYDNQSLSEIFIRSKGNWKG
jgi:two-component sensor histidine kinase